MSKMQQIISPKQIQDLSLKPKMLQSLQMLALPQAELEMQIKRELEMNPILELEEEEQDNSFTGKDEEETEIKKEEEEETVFEHDLQEIKELSDILDTWNAYQREDKSGYTEDERNPLDIIASDKYEAFVKDNKSFFIAQIESLPLSEDEMRFAKELLESTDDFGYLTPDVDIYGLGEEYFGKNDSQTNIRVDEIHKQIMALTPRGITARSVQECLTAQLSPDEPDYELLVTLLNDCFEHLIHRRYQKIAAGLSLSLHKIYHLKEIISHLNPKPGLHLLSHFNDYVIPDVVIKKIEDDFEVIVNDNNIPHLTISSRYKSMLRAGQVTDKETLSFIRDKVNSAKFIIKSIYMRSRTIKRVTWSIINHQRDFFYNESGILEPLTYQIIANDLNICESTVSRVVRNKYADTPFGLFCLKDFFTSTAGRTDDYEEVSRQNVEKHIIRLISEEDRNHPISDLDIANELRKININVSRRVIAKYREGLKILNSRLRRLEE